MHKFLTGNLSVETLTVPVADLPARLEGCRIAQLSDFHDDGRRLSEALLVEAIEAANAAEPDLVLLTGDFVTDDPTPIHHLVRHLKGLEARAGRYAVLGNHDMEQPGAREVVAAALESIDVRVLWNEVRYPLGDGLALVGLADFWSGEFAPVAPMSSIAPGVPRLVMSHNPDTAALLKKWRVDLQLSGHTHGGQIVLPGLGPLPQHLQAIRQVMPDPLRPWLPYMGNNCQEVVLHWEWAQGLHAIDRAVAEGSGENGAIARPVPDGEPPASRLTTPETRPPANWLYVNRGLGTYLPGRLFCSPEVTVFSLRRSRNVATEDSPGVSAEATAVGPPAPARTPTLSSRV